MVQVELGDENVWSVNRLKRRCDFTLAALAWAMLCKHRTMHTLFTVAWSSPGTALIRKSLPLTTYCCPLRFPCRTLWSDCSTAQTVHLLQERAAAAAQAGAHLRHATAGQGGGGAPQPGGAAAGRLPAAAGHRRRRQ